VKSNNLSGSGKGVVRKIAAGVGLAVTCGVLTCARPLLASSTIYTNEADFVAAIGVQPVFLNEFTNFIFLGQQVHPIYATNNGISYTVTSDPPLDVTAFDGAVSTVDTNDQLVVTFNSGNVSGVGGYLYSADANAGVASGSVTISLDDGTVTNVSSTAGTPAPFIGLLSDSLLNWMRLTNSDGTGWPALSHFYVVDGTPAVSIALTGTNALRLSWFAGPTGFVLQASSTVAGAGWTNADATPQLVGSSFQATVPVSGPAQFFRLQKTVPQQ
jgi:hypothetical protein